MATISYNPSVFIQRIENTGNNATREIVVNTTDPLQIADSVDILGVEYIIQNIDTTTKIVTLDKDRDSNIDLTQTAIIEVKKIEANQVLPNPPTPISDIQRKEKVIALAKDLDQRMLNKGHEVFGTDYYGMRSTLESEIRAYLGTFNDKHVPLLNILANAEGTTLDVIATAYKKKLVTFESAKQILRTQFIALCIKVAEAQSEDDLNNITFA